MSDAAEGRGSSLKPRDRNSSELSSDSTKMFSSLSSMENEPESPVFHHKYSSEDSTDEPHCLKESPTSRRAESPRFHRLSMNSDSSRNAPPLFAETQPTFHKQPESPECHRVSIKSDSSRNAPLLFAETRTMSQPQPKSPVSHRVSMNSESSRNAPLLFVETQPMSHPRIERQASYEEPSPTHTYGRTNSDQSKEMFDNMLKKIQIQRQKTVDFSSVKDVPAEQDLKSIFLVLEENIISFVKAELKKLCTLMAADYSVNQVAVDDDEAGIKEAFRKITLVFLRSMNEDKMADRLHNSFLFPVCISKLKSHVQQRFKLVHEGVAKAGSPVLLKHIYTELYITEGGALQINLEHEVRQLETHGLSQPEKTITCEDVFKGPADRQEPIRTVLTKGVAGVGKTVLTQKFSLDWAEGRANQDIQLLFPFTFRALNVLRDTQFSLEGLLHHYFSESRELSSFETLQMVFILDGLDECRLTLDFSRTRVLTDPKEVASVEELLVNLIRGSLLPFACLWITTRPAAANQIPAEYVSMVTEVRGFADPQKEQYFMKKMRDEQQATVVIAHIKSIRSLYIMCRIPVFCWILFTVLENLLKYTEGQELPRTLTNLYIHFLVVQAKVKNIKYHEGSGVDLHWTPETRDMVLSLAKLAFEQLQKGNLIFYESDLRECGLDAAAASVYSGVFTQVFKEEPGLYQDKVYCFIHLSVQEFLAALHVHQIFFSSGKNLLSEEGSTSRWAEVMGKSPGLYQFAVDRALQSPNGHLDLFLRFLLGLSLEQNQKLLQGLLSQGDVASQTVQKTIQYIKRKIGDSPPEKSINLFHCLNELNDSSLVESIQQYLSLGRLSKQQLSSSQWSALVFLLLSSNQQVEEFDLKRFCPSEDALLRLLPVVKASRRSLLNGCNLSQRSCSPLSSVLSVQSSLRELDLSNNPLEDSGVKALFGNPESTSCRLETLRLSACLLTAEGCTALAKALVSTAVYLRELDLSNNIIQDSGASLLLSALDKQGHVKILRLRSCHLSESSCAPLSSLLKKTASSLKELDLSNNDLRDSGLALLCSGLQSTTCELQSLSLSGCMVSEEGCKHLASALNSNPFHIKVLDLSYNYPGETGAQLLQTLIRDPHCKLDTLRVDPGGKEWLVPGPKKYFVDLSLDLNTASKNLTLFNNGKTVKVRKEQQLYPDHPDRFNYWYQVLCTTGLTGRCYWEVERKGMVHIAVTYKNIQRKGESNNCRLGRNHQSWSLRCSEGHLYVWHDSKRTPIPLSGSITSIPKRIAVYLDWPAGSLSFYAVCNGELVHLHSYSTEFTEPLYAAFGFGYWSRIGSSVTLCAPSDRTKEHTK